MLASHDYTKLIHMNYSSWREMLVPLQYFSVLWSNNGSPLHAFIPEIYEINVFYIMQGQGYNEKGLGSVNKDNSIMYPVCCLYVLCCPLMTGWTW